MAGYKMKTHKGAAKRFRMTGSGKFKRKKAYLRHGMRKRSNDAKRSLRQKGYVEGSDHQSVAALLPYA
ncbi:MAG: 50S ribosomal protein L35 [Deltaproteobacteria bacterium]|jgi:large subunit ribosomal protein L35|nr:50S ribosomal protein L35 [Deltaproteobacteria bacterium]MBT7205325.1 50S ribosomal protein L35 [Deltaproteobacteria bacterium]